MDRNSPENYSEQTNMSLEATERFVKDVLDLKCDLVKPIITPRQGGTFFSGSLGVILVDFPLQVLVFPERNVLQRPGSSPRVPGLSWQAWAAWPPPSRCPSRPTWRRTGRSAAG